MSSVKTERERGLGKVESVPTDEDRLARVVEACADGLVTVDGDGRITLANAAAEKILGRPRAELIGSLWNDSSWQTSHPDARLVEKDDLEDKRVLRHGETLLQSDRVITRANGERVTIRVSATPLPGSSGEPVGMVASFSDITDRRRAEELLRVSEERFRNLIHQLQVGVTLHGPSTEILACNAAAWELLGLTEDQLMARKALDPAWNIVHEDGSPFPSATFPVPIALASRHPVRNVVMGVFRPAFRDRVWLLVDAVPQLRPDGAVQQVFCTFSDFTELKRAEHERRNLDQKIQKAQKLESLSVLAGGIAHDFNNLLVGILGNAGLTLMDLPPESPTRHSVHQIEKAALRAADLIRQMLAYSGRGKIIVQPVNLSGLLQEMQPLLHSAITKKAELRLMLPSDLPVVEVDVGQMRQVIMNLLANASEAIGDNSGVITIRAGVISADRSQLSEKWLLETPLDGAYVFVEVCDTGCGMDEATIGKIFDPFFSTKFAGRGLGLAAVLGIVRGHKGAVKVFSKPGAGATFRVLLPCLGGAPNVVPVPNQAKQRAKPGKILVVDDEDVVRDVARTILERAGYEVLTARDGLEAVERVRRDGSQLAAVLLDLMMPRMDGEAALGEIRQLRPDLSVVLMSGYTQQNATNQFAGKGLTGFLQKPFLPADLLAVIRKPLAEPVLVKT
jgi:two-component system cell cycle sensor histidine kinase/response regulator CckA